MRLMPVIVGVVGLACSILDAGVVERTHKRDWTLMINVGVKPYPDKDANRMPNEEPFSFDSAAFVFPMIDRTSTSDLVLGKGVLTLNDKPGDLEVKVLPEPYPSGTKLGKWEIKSWSGKEVELKLTLQTSSYRVVVDEAAALQATWPSEWADQAAKSSFEPQFYIDVGPDGAYDMTPVKDLVRRWMGGKDPKGQSPYMVAKVLAGEVLKHVSLSGNGLNFGRTGLLEGFDLQGAAEVAKRGRGSDFDAICLLTAVYREVGLPARTVIGWDSGKYLEDEKFLEGKRSGNEKLRGWVEFALIDPQNKSLVWVPVDIIRMRKSGTRTLAFEKPWPYFGSNDELDSVVPFAFQFFPPTTVRSYGSPGFWGWLVMPKPPERAEQSLRFVLNSTAKTAEDQRNDREKEKNRKRR